MSTSIMTSVDTLPNSPDAAAVQTRSLWDLVYSCTATIIVCVWVSIHPNVPGRRDTGFQKLRARIWLMLISLIAPEVIVLFALRQRHMAARVCKRRLPINLGFLACTNKPFSVYSGNSPDLPSKLTGMEKVLFYRDKIKRVMSRAFRPMCGYFRMSLQ
jgi:hypothetical protein